MPTLTEADVERALVPADHRWQLSDDVALGLVLRVGKTPSWQLRFTAKPMLKTSIGRPPWMSLDVARAIAVEARERHLARKPVDENWIVAQRRRHGVQDPAEMEPGPYVAPTGAWTWAQGAEAWLHSLEGRQRSLVTLAAYRRCLLHTLAQFADRPLAEVTGEEVQAALDEIAERHAFVALQALRTARPFGQWISRSVRREHTGHDTNRFKTLVEPDTSERKRHWVAPPIEAVARLVAICRSDVFNPVVARALEFILLTGLSRSTVCPLRHDDVRDGILTVRPELLKRHDAIRVPLTPRLQELLRSDDPTWCFPQPRKARTGRRSHLGGEALGRATWELPGAPRVSECHMRMYLHLQNNYWHSGVGYLSDSGGDDNDVQPDEPPRWQVRGFLLQDWSEDLEPLVAEEMARVEPELLKVAMKERRPSRG